MLLNVIHEQICIIHKQIGISGHHLPEALHQVTITMSDRGIPASYRHMHMFGSHTYSYDSTTNNERVWVKFHFDTQQGIKNLTDQEAAELIGKDRESHQRDLI